MQPETLFFFKAKAFYDVRSYLSIYNLSELAILKQDYIRYINIRTFLEDNSCNLKLFIFFEAKSF